MRDHVAGLVDAEPVVFGGDPFIDDHVGAQVGPLQHLHLELTERGVVAVSDHGAGEVGDLLAVAVRSDR